MAEIKPANMFLTWKPDDAAECLDGIPDALYKKLWGCVPDYKPEADSECPPDDWPNALANFWNRFTPGEQRALNAAAERC